MYIPTYKWFPIKLWLIKYWTHGIYCADRISRGFILIKLMAYRDIISYRNSGNYFEQITCGISKDIARNLMNDINITICAFIIIYWTCSMPQSTRSLQYWWQLKSKKQRFYSSIIIVHIFGEMSFLEGHVQEWDFYPQS